MSTQQPWSWWYRIFLAHAFCVFFWIGEQLLFGSSRLTSGNSLQTLHDKTHIPWGAWGILFLTIAFGLLFERARLLAYTVGAIIAFWFITIAVTYTYLPGKTSNVITVLLSTLAIDALVSGMRWSIDARKVAR